MVETALCPCDSLLGELCHGTPGGAGGTGSRGRSAGRSAGSSIPRLVHPPGSSIPPALRVSRKSVVTSDAVGHPWGLAAVGVLASFGLASLWAQPCAWLAE